MNFRQIELALELGRTLSYRRTAEKLFISQPALTHQIKALEEEAGVTLFRRSSAGVTLTPAGALFCRDMEPIMRRAQATLAAVRNCGDAFSDALRVGLNDRWMPAVFAEILRRFADACPDVLPDFRSSSGSGRLDAFLRGELDVLFFMDEAFPVTERIERRTAFKSRLYCVTPPDHPLAAKALVRAQDLAGERVLFCDGAGPAALMRAQEALERGAPIRSQRCPSAENALLWIGAGRGVALMPGFCCDDSGRHAWVPYGWQERVPCSVAWHADDKRACVSAFLRIVADVYAERRSAPGSVL